jgi:lysine-specific demethylase 8
MKGMVDHWQALWAWRDFSFFSENFGHRLVPVEIGSSYLADAWTQRLMPLGEFIQRLLERDLPKGHGLQNAEQDSFDIMYLAQHDLFDQIPQLQSFLKVPVFATLESDQVLKNIWMGMTGTRTPLHTDPYENLFVQIVGYKKVFLVDPRHSHSIPRDSAASTSGNTSPLRLDDQELATDLPFPVFMVLMQPGDMLYIPRGWWHLVLGLTRSISVSFWF